MASGLVTAPTMEGKLVLVADDEPDVLTYLQVLLEDNGYRVLTANDGEQCLEMARQVRPDLITLDVTMPGISGFQVFHDLRDPKAGIPHIPICIITGAADQGHLRYQRSQQVPEGFMKKPIDEPAFLSTVAQILRRRKGEAN